MSTHFFNDMQMGASGWALNFLFITLFFEFTTGIIKAIAFHELKSAKALVGMFKHLIVLAPFLLFYFYMIDVPSPSFDFTFFRAETGDAFAYLFYVVYILSLWTSIAENLDALGIPLPKFVTKILFDANKTVKNGNIKDVAKLGSDVMTVASNPTKAVHDFLEGQDKEEQKIQPQRDENNPELTKETPPTSTNSDVEVQQNKTSSKSTMPKRLN